MNLTISNHRLQGEAVSHEYTTPNHSGSFSAGQPDTIVIHYTAGRSDTSSAKTLCNSKTKASAHLVVGREGKIYQLAPFDTVTWHAGKSSWNGRSGLNHFSVGIEIDNAGRLSQQGAQYLSWFGKPYAPEEVFFGVHRNESAPSFWHRYTETQVLVVEEICRLLCDTYAIQDILGHEEISPDRKTDPGPAFPLDTLRNHLLYADRKTDAFENDAEPSSGQAQTPLGSGLVSTELLNIRYKPNANAVKTAPPLQKGTMLEILEEKNGWYKVKVKTEGWVSSQWVEAKFFT